jgi:hypothetical protein
MFLMNNIDTWFKENYKSIERVAKDLLGDRFGEGISEYYIYLIDKDVVPTTKYYTYWFMKTLTKSNSKINYQPVGFRLINNEYVVERSDSDDIKRSDLKLDLGDDTLVDFMMNNPNNDKWLRIYELIYSKKIKMDLFEEILFEYVFIDGLSIRKIVKITGNSKTSIYQMRKELIKKIKEKL